MPEGSTSPEVLWEDQQRINQFGRLNNQLHELRAELKAKQSLLADLEDAGNELLIADDTEVRYGVGETYVTLSTDEATERLDAATETYKADVSKLTSSIASVQQQMAGLKQALYGKFKDSINLEDD